RCRFMPTMYPLRERFGSREAFGVRELAPLFGGTAVAAGDAKAPASRTHSKRFAELGDIWHVAPAFGVRGACSRFLEGQQWSRAMPKRRQAGRTPNASRNSETFGTSRQRLECVELAPAFWRDNSGCGRCQSAGKPDALQTLRANAGRGSMNRAPAFGVRGACSRFF